MTELINYGLPEEDKDFIVKCLRQMGNHYHNIERDMRGEQSGEKEEYAVGEFTATQLMDKFNEDATTCVLIADRIEAGRQLVVTNYPPEAVEHDTTM